ncbi:Mitochondrial transcription termination factor family protein isoform 3 [Hibiscus syriacus]|uniref:Mitochondrial transcription termination factor family protein isoform 3 n=1 Tax=Hibiscus syriacus TaxID=106335 RepID=A0A6A3C804_HIBSY|nr:transcription termination factor MTERF2, chloroplastic-like [Hibiscus syriacus]KAE8723698.1 Mitochondrial transcription termination factor family protein isoform 3 [Hibiscus syriacus]
MLSYSPPPCLHLHLHRYARSTTISSSLHRQLNHPTTQSPDPVLRIHNSKTTSLLHRQPATTTNNNKTENPPHGNENDQPQHRDSSQATEDNPQTPQFTLPPQEKQNILEMSLVTKRPPQFPGSIYSNSLPSLQSVLQTQNDAQRLENDDEEDEEVMIRRALEIRRKVTAEVFKGAMKKGKFGITYSTNLVNRLPEFIDNVMIEAAALKRLPEFKDSTFNLRARVVIDDSNVVPLIRWLKHNSLSYPKIAKLICMSKGNLYSIRRLVEWLKTVHVKGEFIGSTLLKSGDDILQRRIEELDEIVEYLESNGVRRDWIGFVISRCPRLLSYRMEEVKARVEFYLSMGMNENDFGTMVFDYPGVLGYFTLEEMNEKVNYLKEFGLDTEHVGKLLAFRPQLMGCSIEERWKPLVKYLYYLGITRDGMRRMLTIKPMIFCFDFETTIAPKVQFFRDLGVREDAIGNMLVKFPPLLTYSLHKRIRPVVIFLMTKAGVTEKDIGKVVALGPELFGCSITKTLDVNVKYFLSLGIRVRQLGEMIANFPKLLRYKVDLLYPKYRYLRRTMVRPLQDLIEFPRFFSYSLEERIIPRHKIMVENRVNFKLRYMLACTDEEFDERVADKVERRRRFESGLMENAPSCSSTAQGTPGKTDGSSLSSQ